MADSRNTKRPRAPSSPPSGRGSLKPKTAVGELRTQLDDIGSKIIHAREQLAQERAERAIEADAFAEMLVRVSTTEAALAQALQRANQAEERAKEAEGRANQAEERARVVEEAAESAQAQIDGFREESARLRAELEEDRATLKEQHAAVEAATRAHLANRGEREKFMARVEALEADLSRATAEKEMLEAAVESGEKEVAEERTKVDDLRTQLTALEASFEALTGAKTSLEAALEVARDGTQKALLGNQDLEKALALARADLRDARAQRDGGQESAKKLEQANAQIAALNAKCAMRDSAAAKAMAELEKTKVAMDVQARALRGEIDKIQREGGEPVPSRGRPDTEIALLRAAAKSMTDALRAATAPVAELEGAMTELARRHAETVKLHAASQAMATALKRELAQIASILAVSPTNQS